MKYFIWTSTQHYNCAEPAQQNITRTHTSTVALFLKLQQMVHIITTALQAFKEEMLLWKM
jgi:hypothetical protein